MLNKLRNATLLVVGVLVAFWAVTALVDVVQGGEPDPPGPPGPTMKPLDQVEARIPIMQPDPGGFPIVIDQPGSYYLAGNITGEEGDNGIEISTDNVDLDLNGFALIGADTGTDDGVHVNCGTEMTPANCYNISIKNGTIRDWGEYGVDGQYASNSQFQNLRLYSNSDSGLLAANGSSVIDCVAEAHLSGFGIYALDGVLVSNSVAKGNAFGISVNYGSTASDCIAYDNNTLGISTRGSTARNCQSSFNDYYGIRDLGASLILDNSVQSNGVNGIYGEDSVEGEASRIEGNHVDGDIYMETDKNLIINNFASSYTILSSNMYGEIIAGAQAPIPDTVNSWANFDY
jgi:hypothetical protein